MSRKTGCSRKNHIPSALRSSPRSGSSGGGTGTPRSSPPTSLGDHASSADLDFNYSEDDDDDDNDHEFNGNNLHGSSSSRSSRTTRSERRYLADQIMISARDGQYDAALDDDDDDDDDDFDENDEMKELSPRNVMGKQVSIGSSSGSALETLRAALGGFAIQDGSLGGIASDPVYGERRELSPKGGGGDTGTGGEGSLPHPEEARSAAAAAAASGGSSSGNPRVNAVLACMCPFVRLADAARRQGPAFFWRLLPSILVTKAFWLSLLTLGLCDLATIVFVVGGGDDLLDYQYSQEFGDDYGSGGDDSDADDADAIKLSTDETDATTGASAATSSAGDQDGDGLVKLTFGLWSYSTNPEDRTGKDDDVSFFEAEEERITTCTYHMLHAEEGVVFFMDPIFRTARAFGIITVAVGGIAMVSLWLAVFSGGSSDAAEDSSRGSNGPQRGRRKVKGRGLKTTITIALILCSAFEGLTLLILNSGACGNKRMERAYGQTYRDCEIAEGSSSPITAIVFWFLTGLAMLKLPPDEPDVGSSGSASEFSPDGIEYGTEGGAADTVHARPRKPWWRRIFSPNSSSSLHRSDRQRINGYTTELQFDDAYDEDYDTWRDDTLSVQMRQLA